MGKLTIKTLYMGENDVVEKEDPIKVDQLESEEDVTFIYKVFTYPKPEVNTDHDYFVVEVWIWVGKDPEVDEEDVMVAWGDYHLQTAMDTATKIALADDEEEEDQLIMDVLQTSGMTQDMSLQ